MSKTKLMRVTRLIEIRKLHLWHNNLFTLSPKRAPMADLYSHWIRSVSDTDTRKRANQESAKAASLEYIS